MANENRKCAFCRCPVHQTEDTERQRLYECDECGSVEVISKGNSSWWYHGTYLPGGGHIDGDGRKRTDGRFGWWAKQDAHL